MDLCGVWCINTSSSLPSQYLTFELSLSLSLSARLWIFDSGKFLRIKLRLISWNSDVNALRIGVSIFSGEHVKTLKDDEKAKRAG